MRLSKLLSAPKVWYGQLDIVRRSSDLKAYLHQMVLEKESSILGYPGEVSQPLNGDHHDVCKFASQQDSNYKSIRSVIKTLVSTCREAGILSSPKLFSSPYG